MSDNIRHIIAKRERNIGQRNKLNRSDLYDMRCIFQFVLQTSNINPDTRDQIWQDAKSKYRADWDERLRFANQEARQLPRRERYPLHEAVMDSNRDLVREVIDKASAHRAHLEKLFLPYGNRNTQLSFAISDSADILQEILSSASHDTKVQLISECLPDIFSLVMDGRTENLALLLDNFGKDLRDRLLNARSDGETLLDYANERCEQEAVSLIESYRIM